ncbi:MAG TPA: hypothetical protein VFS21_29865 [Roseiflexaceae bacterium]|nr:hypothetical protein [Roseiflexaceae bacterium]
MTLPVSGAGGSVKIGPTLTAAVIHKVTKWTYKGEKKTTEAGPYVGEPNIVEIGGGKLRTLDIEADVPDGGSTGQDAAVDAWENDTNDRLELETTGGYKITFPTPTYKNVEIATDPKGTQTLKISVSGEATITKPTDTP